MPSDPPPSTNARTLRAQGPPTPHRLRTGRTGTAGGRGKYDEVRHQIRQTYVFNMSPRTLKMCKKAPGSRRFDSSPGGSFSIARNEESPGAL